MKIAKKNEINGAFFDRFSLVHGLSGYLFSKTKITVLQATMLAIGFEILEDKMKKEIPQIFPNPTIDTKENALSDVAVFMLVFLISREDK